MTPVQFLDALDAASAGATPGPWRWEVNLNSQTVWLSGGKRRYDFEVMRFERWGMHSAAPAFLDNPAKPTAFMRADKLAVVVPGREHHAAWFRDIDHPDARHIAAHSPPVTAALRACTRALVDLYAERLTATATESYGMERAREALAALAAAGGGHG